VSKNIILILFLSFFSGSLLADSFNFEKDCPAGKCLPDLVKEAQELTKKAIQEQCLPAEGSSAEAIDKFYDGKEIDDRCLGYLQSIKITNDKIILVQSILEGAPLVSGETQCRADQNVNPDLPPSLLQLAQHSENQCTEEKKSQINSQCGDDFKCALVSSSTTIVGPILKLLNAQDALQKAMPKNCDVSDDNCFAQLMTGFVDAAWNFLKGTWELLGMGYEWGKKKVISGWNNFWGIEDKTSNGQLALAQASEEPGIFQALIDDFPGSMGKMWSGLMTMMKEWIKSDVFCQEWEGVPHLSKCNEPLEGFDCLSCKSMIRGGCSVLGNVLAEIVPSFLTGGAFSVIKHGTNAAVKLGRTLKVSDKLRKAVQLTRLDKLAKVGTAAGKWTLRSATTLGKGYLNSPLHKSTMLALSRVGRMMDNGLTRLVVRSGKTTLQLGGKTVGTTFKVVTFPFDNKLTRAAFTKGIKAGDLLSGKVNAVVSGGVRSVGLSGRATAALNNVDDVAKEMAILETRLSAPRSPSMSPTEMSALVEDARKYEALRADYLTKVQANRAVVLDDLFTKSPQKIELNKVIDELFPELRYEDEFVKTISKTKVVEAERDLMTRIQAVQDPSTKEKLLIEFNNWKSKPSRMALKLDGKRYFHSGEILKNAEMVPEDRFLEAVRLTGRNTKAMKAEEVSKLKNGLFQAHEVGAERGAKVFSYTSDEIRQKARILKEAGYTTDEIDNLLRSGLAGKGFREVIPARGIAFEAARGINAEELKAFRELHKSNLAELLKSGKIKEEMLQPENLVWAHNPKDGIRYLLVKDPDLYSDSFVFSLEKSRWNPFAKAKYTRLSDLPPEFGDLLRLSDGNAIRVTNRFGNKNARQAMFEVIEDAPVASYKQVIDDVAKASKDPNFASFLNKNADEIEALMNSGKFTAKDLVPENLISLKSLNGKEDLLILRNDFLPEHYRVYSEGKSVSLKEYAKTTGLKYFETVDGKLIHIGDSGGFGAYFDEYPSVLSKAEAENSYADLVQRIEKNSKITNLSKPLNAAKDDILFELRKGSLSLDPVKGADATIIKLKNGDDAIVFLKPTPNGDKLEYIKLFKKGQYLEKGYLDDIASEVTTEVRFSNRAKYKVWNYGDGPKVEKSIHITELYENRINALVKRYAIKDANGNLIFDDYINFLNKHRDDILKVTQEGSNPNIGLKNFAKATTDKGDELYLAVSPSLRDSTVIFTPSGPKSLSEVLKDGKLVLSDGRTIIRDSAGKYSYNKTPKSLENFQLVDAVGNSEKQLSNRISDFSNHLKGKGQTLTPELEQKVLLSLEQSMQYSAKKGTGVFTSTTEDLKAIVKIFDNNSVPREYSDYLIRSGYAARPPTSILGFADEGLSPFANASFQKRKDIFVRNLEQEFAGKMRRAPSQTAKLSSEEIKRLSENLDGMYFVDYQHHSDELLRMAKGETRLADSKLRLKYNENGDKAFENFQNASVWLNSEKPPLNTQTMKKIHLKMMEGGVENLQPQYMGAMRPSQVYGNASRGISPEAVKVLRENPYVSFLETGRTSDGLIKGQIWYPNVEVISEDALNLIRKSNPEVVEYIELRRALLAKESAISDRLSALNRVKPNLEAEVSRLEAELVELNKSRLNPNFADKLEEVSSNLDAAKLRLSKVDDEVSAARSAINQESSEIKQQLMGLNSDASRMNKNLVDALTEEALQRFNKKRDALGVIDTPEKYDRFVDDLAELQRDMVSIHPLGNGNGRTTREFALYYPLKREGFPPPRILDTNNDLYQPLSAWSKEIKEGIRNSQKLIDDFEYRSRMGLKLEESPYLLSPKAPPETMELTFKLQGKKDVLTRVEKVDPNLFHHYRMQVIESDNALKELVRTGKDPSGTWDFIDKKATELYKRDNIYFDHQKKGLERLGLGPVTREFKDVYGKAVSADPLLYERKMSQFYDDQVVWRGLASKNSVKSEEELINFFRESNNHMASNAVLGKRLSKADDIRKAGLDDLEKYRKAIEVDGDEGIVRMAKDHSETGPMYGQSWGYSTSKDRKVGKAFAQGAMVVAPYGQHQKFQHLLKQRVLVGGMKAKTDVDLSRLKNLRNEFSYKYPRQQEVMGVGAMDPDAIQVVQTLDEAGKATTTYLRNPERPYEVLVIKGEVNPGDKIPRDLIEKVIDLRN